MKKATLYIALSLALILGNSGFARAGQNVAYAFDMGWYLGVASYQASSIPVDPGYSGPAAELTAALGNIRNARDVANKLQLVGILGPHNVESDITFGTVVKLPNSLEVWREKYEQEMRQRSRHAANAYKLGLLIGLAEGQCTSSVAGSAWYANDALMQARNFMATSQLSTLSFDRQLLNSAISLTAGLDVCGSAYPKVVGMRTAYRTVLLFSSY
jgi:hypothetical protein